MTPEQKYGYHRKHGRLPEETPKRKPSKFGQVFQGNHALTEPLPWALAGFKLKEFKLQGLKNLKLRRYE